MRGGSESFIIKDSAFYGSKMTAALGVETVAVYEELRAHVWRSRNRGNKKLKAEIRNGHLSANVRRRSVAESTGLSLSTVQRRLNTLREIGWVRSENGQPLGEALVYELGYLLPGGVEVFYADVDCREFCLHLEKIADNTDEEVHDIPVAQRVALAKEWFANENRAVFQHTTPSGSPKTSAKLSNLVGESQRHPSCSPVTLEEGEGESQRLSIIDNPSGYRIDKSEEHTGRGAPERVPAIGVEPGDRLRATEKKLNCSSSGSNIINNFLNDQDKEQEPKFAIDNDSDLGDDGTMRVARAKALAEEAKGKADSQRESNTLRRVQQNLRESRTKQLEEGRVNEQRAANLKGKQFPQTVYVQSRHVWDVYVQLLNDLNSTIPTVRWNAEGNVKARGQMCRLVDMYGGETVELAVRYVVGNWERIGKRYFKDPGGVPNLGRLVALHESLVREAVLWGQHRDVLEEWEQWYVDHPMESAPDELKERYGDAHKALSALGFGA